MPLAGSGVDLLTLTTTLAYMGLAAALGLAAVSLLLLLKTRRRPTALAYLALSGLFIFTLARVLLRAAGGVICYRSPVETVLLYGGLIALHLYFIWDGWRTLRRDLALPACGEGGGE